MDEDLQVKASIRDDLSGPLRRIRSEVDGLGDAADRAGRRAGVSSRGWSTLDSAVGRFARFAGRTALFAAGALTSGIVALGGAAAAIGISTAADMQQAEIAFTTMLGSARKAKSFLEELKDFAAATPFEFPELQTAASQLIAAGIEAGKVIPIMTTLGDVTAGMGTGAEGIQRATNAIQQMIAADKIMAEDLNQLRGAGIPVYDLLAEALGKTKKEVSELLYEGKLGGEALAAMMQALETGKGLERFAGLMEKQSASLSGTWSTLKDTVSMGLADAFKPAVPILTDLNTSLAEAATQGLPHFQRGLQGAIRLGEDLVGAFQKGGLDGVSAELEKAFGPEVAEVFDKVREVVEDAATVFTDLLVPAFGDVVAAVGPLAAPLTALDDVLGWIADNAELLRPILTGLIAAIVAWRTITLVMTAAQWLLNVALTANPVGLVIVAIAALAAGLYLAYQKSETFRNIVDRLWGLFREYGQFLLGFVLGPFGLLIGAFVTLYRRSDTFRSAVDGLWNNVLKPFGQWLGTTLVGFVKTLAKGWLLMGEYGVKAFRLLVTAAMTAFEGILWAADKGLSWVPGLGDKISAAKTAFSEFKDSTVANLKKVEDGLRRAREQIDQLARDRTATVTIITRRQGAETAAYDGSGGTGYGPVGDTRTRRGGAGGIASTLWAHQQAQLVAGSRLRITNAFVGGGGAGHGSGDHQAGRALDLQGPGVHAYARATREMGGYAAFHGSGADRHLHAVPAAAGDTRTSKAAPMARGGATGRSVVVEAGAVVVQVHNPGSNVDVTAAVEEALERIMRDADERGRDLG